MAHGLQWKQSKWGYAADWGNIFKVEQSEFANELDGGIYENGKIKDAL